MSRANLSQGFLVLLGVYSIAYLVARSTTLHAVEHYAGGFKALPRQDFITKRDRSPGEGWEYHFFLPVIRVEEMIRRL